MSGRQVAKCDLCEDRLEGNGETSTLSSVEAAAGVVPRCVAACPAGALIFAEETEVEASGLQVIGGRTAGEHPLKRR